MGGVWYVKMGKKTSGRFMVYMGDEVETKSVLNKWAMGRMKFNETWTKRHGMFGAHEEEGLI